MTEEMTIQEVAVRTGLSKHTLRYYERAGLLLPIARAENGHRRYAERDIETIVWVTHMRSTGMPIAEIKRYIDLAKQGSDTVAERLALMEDHREAVLTQIAELENYLTMIDHKIEGYRAYCEAREKEEATV